MCFLGASLKSPRLVLAFCFGSSALLAPGVLAQEPQAADRREGEASVSLRGPDTLDEAAVRQLQRLDLKVV